MPDLQGTVTRATSLLACAAALAAWVVSVAADRVHLNITVPSDYNITTNDAYVCVIAELPAEPHKLVGVVPLADPEVVHHILLYGCQQPAKAPQPGQTLAWNCMHHGVCGGGTGGEIMYGWGRNATSLQLPNGVGFAVGGGTNIQFIVVQVHFKGARPGDAASGVTLRLLPAATPYAAGIISFASRFSIPPNTPSTNTTARCCYNSHQPVTTFAFRVHTHALGRSVTMHRPSWAEPDALEQLATNDPQLPQAFYPVAAHTLWPGDKLQVTCDFDSRGRDTVTHAGPSSSDEMCNMYMLVYGSHPFLAMCTGMHVMTTTAGMPGTFPLGGTWMRDPCAFWKPPAQPENGGDLGDATGVAIAGDGAVWALYRGDKHWDAATFDSGNVMLNKAPIAAAVVVRLDPDTGKVTRSIGAGLLSLPHMLTVDQTGAVWVVDVGAHTVLKLSPQGEVLLRLGTPHQPGSGTDCFCKPTHVAVARDGTVYVGDGYCNNRVARFAANGTFTGEFSIPGAHTGPVPGGYPIVHALLLDECNDLLYIALREAKLVVVTSTLTWGDAGVPALALPPIRLPQRVWSLTMGPYGMPLAMSWELTQDAILTDLSQTVRRWRLPDVGKLYPHQMALGAAPPVLSGAADRLFALYLAPTCARTCGPLLRFIMTPRGFQVPDQSQLQQPLVFPAASLAPQLSPPLSPSPSDTAGARSPPTGDMNQTRLQPALGAPVSGPVQTPAAPGAVSDGTSGIAGDDPGQPTHVQMEEEDLIVFSSRLGGTWQGGWVGSPIARGTAFIAFAAAAAVVVWVASKHIAGRAADATQGKQATYGAIATPPASSPAPHQAEDIATVLERSAALDTLQDEAEQDTVQQPHVRVWMGAGAGTRNRSENGESRVVLPIGRASPGPTAAPAVRQIQLGRPHTKQ